MSDDMLEQRVKWMDDQRRKDAELVSRLVERVEAWESEIQNHERQIKELSGDVARLGTLSSRIGEFDHSLSRQREDVAKRIDEVEMLRRERENQLWENVRQHQHTVTSAIDELREAIPRIVELEETMDLRREEEQRLSRELDSLGQSIERVAGEKDELSRQLVALEEGRGQQSKRVAELQMETSDLRVRIDTTRGEVDNVEARVRRLGTTVAEVSAHEGERNDRQRLAAEQQEMKMTSLEREWKKWQKTLEDQEGDVQEAIKRFVAYEETLRDLKQLEKSITQAVERFERRIHELAEMQRLAEERIKQEWTAFQADNQKKWNTQKLTFDEHWREHKREHDKLVGKTATTGEDISELALTLNELEADSKKKVSDLVELIHKWATDLE